MTRSANFSIEYARDDALVLRDEGPWDQHPSITNDAEGVVARVAPQLGNRRVFYIDSEGQLDELRVLEGRFVGFLPGAPKPLTDALR